MKRFIRWQGIVGFLIFVGLIAAFVYVFAESLVKKGIEAGGGYYLGAEVNVGEVEITYSPLTLTVKELQATDAEKPTTNVVSFTEATASVDVWQYLFGKVIIDDLSLEGLAFSSPRATEGDVYLSAEELANKKSLTEEFKAALPSVDISLPDPQSLLNDSNLLTVKRAETLQQSYQTERDKLEALKAKLPNKATLAEYEKQVKALTKVKVKSLQDIEKIKRDYDTIKQKFEADRAVVAQAKEQLASSQALLTTQLNELKNAPNEDWQRLEKEYQLDKVDTADFAHILFGAQAREYYQYFMTFVDKVRPLMASSASQKEEEKVAAKGRFVHFKEDNPLPEFLIKNANLSVVLPQGDIEARLQEVTNEHWVRGKPTIYHLASNNLYKQGKLVVDGDLALDAQNAVSSNTKWSVENVQLDNVDIQSSDKLQLSLAKGVLLGKGQWQLTNSQINASNEVNMVNTQFTGQGSSKVSEMLIDTLSATKTVALNLGVTGELSSPEWQISSPLDNLLKDALQQKVQQTIGEFQDKVQAGLNDKLAGALNMENQAAQDIINFDALLSDTDKSLENLMNADVVKQQEEALKNKAKDKLKDKLGDLFGNE